MKAPVDLPAARVALLRACLDGLGAATDARQAIGQDPLAFARRYPNPADAEVAAVFASALAFGRVSLFWPVVAELIALADSRGGPAAFVEQFDASDAARLAPLIYRWNRGIDLALLAMTLGSARRASGSLGALVVAGFRPEHADIGPCLEAAIQALRGFALQVAPSLGLSGRSVEALPRGFRTFLPLPSEGSACKRWNMLLRWMVRRPGSVRADGQPQRADGVDLGLWDLPPDRLIIPLDTHVLRLAGFLGLTDRKDGSWRTAAEITARLRQLDPADPVRYDFALAHLGISGRCQARRVPEICDTCGLVRACRVGAP